MITREDFEIFEKVFREAVCEQRAIHIAKIFAEYDKDFKYADDWDFDYHWDPNTEEFRLKLYCSDAGEFGDTSVSFDAHWLYATDKELKQYVQNLIDERRREEEEKERVRLEALKRRQLLEQKTEEGRRKRQLEFYEKANKMSREELLIKLGVPEEYITD